MCPFALDSPRGYEVTDTEDKDQGIDQGKGAERCERMSQDGKIHKVEEASSRCSARKDTLLYSLDPRMIQEQQ